LRFSNHRVQLPSREAVEHSIEQSIIDSHVEAERARILEDVECIAVASSLEFKAGYNEAKKDIIKTIKGK